MENEKKIEDFMQERNEREMEEKKKILDEFMREYGFPTYDLKRTFGVKRWLQERNYFIKDEIVEGKHYKVLYKGRRITKWCEDIHRRFKDVLGQAIIDRVGKEEFSILKGNQNGLPEDELTEDELQKYRSR